MTDASHRRFSGRKKASHVLRQQMEPFDRFLFLHVFSLVLLRKNIFRRGFMSVTGSVHFLRYIHYACKSC